jgi:hypothetical protein|tara:strand:- start:876 stop:1046 length:171 start_codon:yes stop_codon:yes gene_type:complete
MTQYDVFPTYQKIIDGERILYVHVNNKIIETKWADGTVQIETKQSNDKWKITQRRK